MAGTRILILSRPGDQHSYAVAEAIACKGGQPIICQTTDFPARAAESARLRHDGIDVDLHGLDWNVDPGRRPVHAVWRRRGTHMLDAARLHPADVRFADTQCATFRDGLYDVLAPQAFWVNPHSAALRADLKLPQQRAAQAAGFLIPDTLYTNDPASIRRFIGDHPEGVVYKPLEPITWRDDQALWAPYTTRVGAGDLVADELLRAAPGIYQALMPKAYELRVTVMGAQVFAVKVLSQETLAGRLDWRLAYHELRMEPYDLAPEDASRCRALLSALGLVFGCFDLIMTPRDKCIFLEVNEGGQFLFIEQYADLPLLDAFTEFLLQGRPDFTWTGSTGALRYRDIEARAGELAARSLNEHVRADQTAREH